MKQQRHAFTLVELSIVLVILGLLVGGVLTGQSLIRAAELRTVSSDFPKYQTAVNAFKDKYFAMPGKMTNATAFWGKNNAACPGDTGTAATPGTCNGDGLIAYGMGNDGFLFWQHLALAGMVEGTFAGEAASADGYTTYAGVYVPKARIGNGYYGLPFDSSATINVFPGNNHGGTDPLTLLVGTTLTDPAANTCYGCGGVLSEEDAWNIDTKMDDGIANSGKLNANLVDLAGTWSGPTCPTYDLSDKTTKCPFFYQLFQ